MGEPIGLASGEAASSSHRIGVSGAGVAAVTIAAGVVPGTGAIVAAAVASGEAIGEAAGVDWSPPIGVDSGVASAMIVGATGAGVADSTTAAGVVPGTGAIGLACVSGVADSAISGDAAGVLTAPIGDAVAATIGVDSGEATGVATGAVGDATSTTGDADAGSTVAVSCEIGVASGVAIASAIGDAAGEASGVVGKKVSSGNAVSVGTGGASTGGTKLETAGVGVGSITDEIDAEVCCSASQF